MGVRAIEWWFYKYATSLDSPLQAIMSRAVAHCLDDEALLRKSRVWLAEKAGTSTRSMERHEPTLKDLGLLVRGDDGYRLPLFFEFDRQNGGPLTLPYSEGLKPGKEIHTHTCVICTLPHEWTCTRELCTWQEVACPLVLAGRTKVGL